MENKILENRILLNLEITSSKVLAYVIIIAALFVFDKPQDIMAAWYLGGGLIGAKTILGEVGRMKR